MDSTQKSWLELFKTGKWKDCAAAIDLKLKESSFNTDLGGKHIQRLFLENNLFICSQLSVDWDSMNEDSTSSTWAKSYNVLHQIFNFMRCQSVCSELPLELVLCTTCNLLWWTNMKVDPLQQHSNHNDSLVAALFSFKAVGKTVGEWNVEHQSTGCVETDFILAINTLVPYLPKLSPIQSQLVIEVITLSSLILGENYENPSDNIVELIDALDHVVEFLPLMKVHLTQGQVVDKLQVLLKFGKQDIGQILNTENHLTVSETLLITIASLSMKVKTKSLRENSERAMMYLNLIEKDELAFPFLYHYMHAFANFHCGNFSTSLYHLQHTIMCSSNSFMQGRSKTLKGQILLLENKPAAALEVLQSVQYKLKDVQIPMCAFLIGKAYGMLGEAKQQAEIFELLLECLSAEPAFQPKLVSPLAGMEQLLLLFVHNQPEVSYQEVLQACATAHLSSQQPQKAFEKIMELLQITVAEMNDDIEDSSSMWKLSELLHDAASALLEGNSMPRAQEVCEAALQFHNTRLALTATKLTDISSLKEDVIALLLLAEAKESQESSDVPDILNRCARLLQNLIEKQSKSGKKQKEAALLTKALLARIYLRKAIINAKKNFEDDAVACFQRALYWKADDPEVILRFAYYLLEANQEEESLALWQMFKDCEKRATDSKSFALNHLLGGTMSLDQREEIELRLQSLSSS